MGPASPPTSTTRRGNALWPSSLVTASLLCAHSHRLPIRCHSMLHSALPHTYALQLLSAFGTCSSVRLHRCAAPLSSSTLRFTCLPDPKPSTDRAACATAIRPSSARSRRTRAQFRHSGCRYSWPPAIPARRRRRPLRLRCCRPARRRRRPRHHRRRPCCRPSAAKFSFQPRDGR